VFGDGTLTSNATAIQREVNAQRKFNDDVAPLWVTTQLFPNLICFSRHRR